MSGSSKEASDQLAEIDAIVARVKQSGIYRTAGAITMMWGVLHFVRQGFFALAPVWASSYWFAIDAVGIAITVEMLSRLRMRNHAALARTVAVFALFYGFGWVWSHVLGDMEGRQLEAFWPTLALFGFSLAGLWFGVGFLALGLSLTALLIFGYEWAGPWYHLWVTATTGGGFLLFGYLMRRA